MSKIDSNKKDEVVPGCSSCLYWFAGWTCDRHLNKVKPDYSKGSECGSKLLHYRPNPYTNATIL